MVNDQSAVTNAGARPGDALVLTKCLGTGLLATALKKGLLDDAVTDALVASLLRLNRDAGGLLHAHAVHAATDVTGFGLVGHGGELARAAQARVEIDLASLPLLPWLDQAVAANCITVVIVVIGPTAVTAGDRRGCRRGTCAGCDRSTKFRRSSD